jgi:23S rRNA pseudouridine1911/1915/1917 synthase
MTGPILRVIVPDSEDGLRVDVFCTHKIEGFSRSFFSKLCASDHITINGKPVKSSHKVKVGEHIVIEMVSPPPVEAVPENIALDIAYEDEYLVVVNKPAGMVSHPAAGNYTGTLINALLHHFSTLKEFSDKLRPGLVHRLDKDTSGLLVAAKDEKTMIALQRLLKDRLIERIYTAIIWGKMPQPSGSIDLPLGRCPVDRKKMRVYGQGQREAITYYDVVKNYSLAEMLRIKLGTGRTHQIRVHLSYFGNPVVGDPTYGGRAKAVTKLTGSKRDTALGLLRVIERQALHASNLNFTHPITGIPLRLSSALPDDIQKVVNLLENSVSA